jgi:hypothetical protein
MFWIFSAVSRLISGLFCRARETVEEETFAMRAMSLMEVGLWTRRGNVRTRLQPAPYFNCRCSGSQLTALVSPACREIAPLVAVDSTQQSLITFVEKNTTSIGRCEAGAFSIFQIAKVFRVRRLPGCSEIFSDFPLPDDRVFQHREQRHRP